MSKRTHQQQQCEGHLPTLSGRLAHREFLFRAPEEHDSGQQGPEPGALEEHALDGQQRVSDIDDIEVEPGKRRYPSQPTGWTLEEPWPQS